MNPLATRISTTFKELRKARGWSLDIASQKTGVSKAMLGQIERGESSPTIATLWKIASGFDVSFSSFVDEEAPVPSTHTHRTPALQQIHADDDTINVMSLFPYDKTLGFEMFMIELLPGCTHLSPAHQEGVVEHIVPVQGTLEILIGDTWHKVACHEGLRFSASQPHGYRNLSQGTVLFHDIIHYTLPSI
ncbi:MAG: DNA-binding protein [Candidatus Puniceispirillum sp.]|nr:DNA-binding protein [Candidatus Puniceispirillum sp.]